MSSSTSHRPKSSSQFPTYQPIPTSTAMDNPAMTRSSHSGSESLDDPDRTGAGTLPSTYSSQHLMPSSASDSMEDIEKTPDISVPERTSASCKEWIIVGVLCFVNLINYMDRFTIAGVLEDIQTDFKLGDDDGGLLQTMFIVSYMIFAPLFGYLGDRYSRRYIMALGILLWSGTTLLGSFMGKFGWFLAFRGMVGIGEASYSTIAPTIISDMFVNKLRSKMLAAFYFAIPVGSGIGYIVGSGTAHMANDWRWALRVTPFLGFIAVALILFIEEPIRGQAEGASHPIEVTSYKEDVKYLSKNFSFIFSTLGFTCVAFVAGALSWWAPKFILLGFKMQEGNADVAQNDVSFNFGVITMISGILGVPFGSMLSQKLIKKYPKVDPLICGIGLLISMPLMAGALLSVSKSSTLTYILIFFAQFALNLNWAVVADILLYVVVPTRRSTGEAFQILFSHLFGDAGSPYLIGVVSEAIKRLLRAEVPTDVAKITTEPLLDSRGWTDDTDSVRFRALQYALFLTCFVEVLGGIFFIITSLHVVRDRNKANQAIRDGYVS